MTERIKRLLRVFQKHNHDTLVLGAFGCGVFKNNPLNVARTFQQQLQSSEFIGCFRRIVFAVLDAQMCSVFIKVFNETNSNCQEDEFTNMSLNDPFDDRTSRQRPYYKPDRSSKQRKQAQK
jgi:hypothetical protein